LCFFCALDDTLELKEPIMDWGAGGGALDRRP